METLEEVQLRIAKKHGLGKLVTGHAKSIFDEVSLEFAKMHVQKALSEASENTTLMVFGVSDTLKEWNHEDGTEIWINKDSILNAYNFENIK